MGTVCSNLCYDDFTIGTLTHSIKPEDIHLVLSEMFTILTDNTKSFDDKRTELYCKEKQYRCFVNINYPYMFNYTRDCFSYEYFTYIATVGNYAINVFAYSDLLGWVVCNTGSSYMRYDFGGCSKLQLCVATRKQLSGDQVAKYELKIKEIERRRLDCDFCRESAFVDWRSKPKVEIIEPKNKSNVGDQFSMLAKIVNWKMKEGGLHARIFVDDIYLTSIYNNEMFNIDLSDSKKGWHTISIRLYDEENFVNIYDEVKVCLIRQGRESNSEKCKKCRRRKCNCTTTIEDSDEQSDNENSDNSEDSEDSEDSVDSEVSAVSADSGISNSSGKSAEQVAKEIIKDVKRQYYERSINCGECSPSSTSYRKYRARRGARNESVTYSNALAATETETVTSSAC
jgi:hypothetical protein